MTVRYDLDLSACERLGFGGGRLVLFSARKPGREGPNEDGALLVASELGAVLAVADGAGGEAAGAQASAEALAALHAEVSDPRGRTLRETILSGFEEANRRVLALGVGAATTLAAVELGDGAVRTYHVGDSLVLLVGQRGKRKLETIAHSPTGYAVEAGMLDEADALHHEERHLVSNMVGVPEMRVEMSGRVALAARDTLLLASDGLSDNVHVEELVDTIRKGPLDAAGERLAATARRRMERPNAGEPSKPDDLTFLLYRSGPGSPPPARRRSSKPASAS
jgi:serine/threonine protein phosphatase PrpC